MENAGQPLQSGFILIPIKKTAQPVRAVRQIGSELLQELPEIAGKQSLQSGVREIKA